MDRVGTEIIQERKKFIMSEKSEENKLGQKDLGGRDLLSLLLKANLASDVPESQRLNDAEVLARTFCILLVEQSELLT